MNKCKALDHLVRVIGLCQLPRDNWTSEDNKLFREAGEFVRTHQKEKSVKDEDEDKTGSGSTSEPSREGKDSEPVDGEVSEDEHSVKEGLEHPKKPD